MSLEPSATRFRSIISQRNRSVLGEAIVTLAVGVGSCILVFGFIFWMTYLGLWFVRPFGLRYVAWAALSITVAFALVSVWSAWRRRDPFDNVEAMDPTLQDLQLGLGYALGVPVFNRQSVAGFASLLIGGPANILDAWSIWRTRIQVDDADVVEGDRLLRASRQGVASNNNSNPQAVALLYRLGLIKAVRSGDGAMMIQAAMKGLDLIH